MNSQTNPMTNNWRMAKFTEVAELRHGYQFRDYDFVKRGIPVVKIGNLKDGGEIDLSSVTFIAEERLPDFSDVTLQSGDILMALTGATLGKVSRIKKDFGFLLQNYRVGLFKGFNGIYHDDFLYHILQSEYVQKEIENLVNQAAQPNIGKGDFDKFHVPVPPLPEQIKIAQILSEWNKLIDTQTKLIAAKEKRKQALMQKLLSGEVRFKGFEDEWGDRKIKDLGKVVSGGTPDTTNPEYWDGDISWCTPTDITKLAGKVYIDSSQRRITNSGLANSSATLLPPNSLVVCTRATIGFCAVNRNTMTTNQGFKSIIPKDNDVLYLFYLISSMTQELVSLANGSTFLEISKTDFENIEVRIPSLPEQQKIASVLSACDIEIQKLKKELEAMRLQKKGLMQNLLTGKIRVKV